MPVCSLLKHIVQLNLQHPLFHQAELQRSQTLTSVSLTPPARKYFLIAQIFSYSQCRLTETLASAFELQILRKRLMQ